MDSDDYATDDGRKRRAVDMEETFERSKKTLRTPVKQQKGENGKLDQILGMMKEMNADQKDIKQEQKEIKKEIQQIREVQKGFNEELLKLKIENEILKKENQDIKQENVAIRKEIQDIRGTLEVLEKERRKNKVIMNGLKMDTKDPTVLKEGIREFLSQHLQLDIRPKTVMKIRESTYVIELENEIDKQEIMANKAKLKNIREEKVFINEDMTKKEREKQKLIRLFAKSEKEKGKEVKIGYNKVIVNGEPWRWNKNIEKIENAASKN